MFSIIKAMGTICVDHSEIGKINAVLAAIENLIPLLGAQGYTVLWKVCIVFLSISWLERVIFVIF